MKAYEIEGIEVLCETIGGKRLWLCQCPYFKERFGAVATVGGYCPHIAVAMWQEMGGTDFASPGMQ